MPADATPSALDALLVRVGRAADLIDDTRYGKAPLDSVEAHGTLANAAPRLAAIVRVLREAATFYGQGEREWRGWQETLPGTTRVSGGYVGHYPILSDSGDKARTALARAEAIASGRDPATTPNPTTPTIPADAPASDAGSTAQHKEP